MENNTNSTQSWRLAGPGTVCLAIVLGLTLLMPTQAVPSVQAATALSGAPSPILPKGMDKATVESIDRGLRYLAATQKATGEWFPTGGYGSYPTVMTALAGLAFIAGGSTPETGPYARNVRKAMHYCLRVAEAEKDGMIASTQGGEGRSMYGHGFALLFLSQCYGMEMDEKTEKRLREVLNKAVKITQQSQSNLGKALNEAGGWIYTPDGGSDEGSVTVTQLQALRGCRNAGIVVNTRTIERAVAYLKASQNGDGGISYSFASRGSSRPAISAAGIACFYSAGVFDRMAGGREGVEAEMVDKLVKYCQTRINVEGGGDFGGHYFYTELYYSEALYQRGGKDWDNWYPKISKKLISMQGGDGSWAGDGVGTTYGTAIATIIMQLPYGYLPICQR